MNEEDPLDVWRQAVGYSASFPRLDPLDNPAPIPGEDDFNIPTLDTRRIFMTQPYQQVLGEICDSLGTSKVIQVAPGHGASTLARYAFQTAKLDVVRRRSIPVLLTIEDLSGFTYGQLADAESDFLIKMHPELGERRFNKNPEEVREEANDLAIHHFGRITEGSCQRIIEARIRLAVIQSLITHSWRVALTPTYYRDLIGSNSASQRDITQRQEELSMLLRNLGGGEAGVAQFWKAIERMAPTLFGDYQQIIRELNSKGRIRISLLLDLSPTPVGRQYLGVEDGEYLTEPYFKVLKCVSKALTSIMGEMFSTFLDTTYFMPELAWNQFSADLHSQESDVIPFEPYRPVDVFAMLTRRYPPHYDLNTGPYSEALANVLDSEFVQISATTAISTEMVLLEQQLRSRMAKQPPISYHVRFND